MYYWYVYKLYIIQLYTCTIIQLNIDVSRPFPAGGTLQSKFDSCNRV